MQSGRLELIDLRILAGLPNRWWSLAVSSRALAGASALLARFHFILPDRVARHRRADVVGNLRAPIGGLLRL